MSIADKSHGLGTGFARSFQLPGLRRQARLVAILGRASALVVALAAIFVAGHPFVAVWLALAAFAWMFVAGAAKASEE